MAITQFNGGYINSMGRGIFNEKFDKTLTRVRQFHNIMAVLTLILGALLSNVASAYSSGYYLAYGVNLVYIGSPSACAPTAQQSCAKQGGLYDASVGHCYVGSISYYSQYGCSYSCPDPNSHLNPISGSNECLCNVGYIATADNTGCTPSAQGGTVANLLNTSQPHPESSCPIRTSKPITPLLGAETHSISSGFTVGGQTLILTWDNRKIFAASAVGSTPKTFGNMPALGALWESSLHKNLHFGNGSFGANLMRGNGTVISFQYNTSTGLYQAAPGSNDTLVATSGTNLLYTNASGVLETYNSLGRLLTVADVVGNTLSYSYSTAAAKGAPAAGYLMRIVDNTGRTLNFAYTLPTGGAAASDGLLTTITDTAGQVITLTYDGNNNLSTIAWPDGKTQQYVYENTSLPWALTGYIDENASRFVTWGYDSTGRAISSILVGGVEPYSITYTTPPGVNMVQTYNASTGITTQNANATTPSGVVMNLPNGQSANIGATTINGLNMATSLTQPAGSGCASSNSASTFDTNGNLTSKDDFSSVRTCFAYDGSNREVTRVEGLTNTVACSSVLPSNSTLPVGARKFTTTWHPGWKIPVAITAPRTVTTNVYQGQPDPFNSNVAANCTSAANLPNGKPLPVVCKQVVQALKTDGTIDASVPNVVSSATYDTSGRILTFKDTNSNTTTYAYYTSSTMPVSADSNFSKVALLLHGQGVNGAQTFVDSSKNAFTPTLQGQPIISTAQSKFGGGSIYLNGSSFLSFATSTPFNVGSNDFTLETWFMTSNASTDQQIAGNRNVSISSGKDVGLGLVFLGASSKSQVEGYVYTPTSSYGVVSNTKLSANTWYHIAFVRQGGMMSVYINGILDNSAAVSGSVNAVSQFNIGTYSFATPQYVTGWLNDFRFTNGIARYTGSFSVPAASFPDAGTVTASSTGHMVGDLQSVSDARGNVTTFDIYDPYGRLLQKTDPKGIITTYSYTPRGFLASETVTAPGQSARATTYSYDAVGQLIGVSNPDGTSQSYSYDAAHRLVGASDTQGNSVSYTLDNAGNRVGEQIKDPSGALQRSISRSFDALNRMQQLSITTP